MRDKMLRLLPGVAICLSIALPSWLLGKAFPMVGGPVTAIFAGMLIANLFPRLMRTEKVKFIDGVRYTSKKLLQYSIVMLGFGMNLFNVIEVGSQSLLIIVFTLAAAFLTAFFIGKALKLPGDTVTLIGVGTSICGGSAIAATASVIHAKDEDVARSISTIFLFNVIAVFIFPPLGHLLGMSDASFGMWAGTAINDTSSVVAAGALWSSAAGNNIALQTATVVKLTRTLMIIPITLFLAVYTARKQKHAAAGGFNFVKIFPWFAVFFLLAAIANTFAGIPGDVSNTLVAAGKFIIVMAMAAIGLNTDMKSLVKNGAGPVLLGLCCWFAVSATALVVQALT